MRKKGATDARIHHDEALVFLVEVVIAEYLAVSTEVEASVGTLDNLDVLLLGDDARYGRVAVENEDEVGFVMQTLLDEELEILLRCSGLGKGV